MQIDLPLIKSRFYQIIKKKDLLLFFIVVISGTGLLGWATGKSELSSFFLTSIPIAPATALIFLILCILLDFYIEFRKTRFVQAISMILITLICLICALVCFDYFFNFKWDIEKIFISNPEAYGNVVKGRMSPITASLSIAISLGILAFGQTNANKIKYFGGTVSLLVFLVSSVLLIGYLYEVPLLYGSRIIPVSFPSAVCFFLFSITLLRVYEARFWTYNLIRENNVTYQLLKSFLPFVVFMVVLHGYLDTVLSFKYNNPPLISAFILFMVTGFTIYIIIRISEKIGAQLKESEKKLHQLNVDKDRFISILAHDLKGPFSNLISLSELLAKDIRSTDTSKIEILATHINKSTVIIYNLLEDLLMWASAQTGKIPFNPHMTSLGYICKNIHEVLYMPALAKNITIDYSDVERIDVFADTDMLKTILRNLVSNAIKFSNGGGKVTISAEQTPSAAMITVSDNGVGIRQENLAGLFDITQVITTKGTAGETGTGFGLLLCKEFIEKHGGKILVESTVGKGSDFRFSLPLPADWQKYNQS